MKEIIKKILRLKTIKWVKNTQIKHKHLEAKEYLLVESHEEGSMLFTLDQVKHAKKRAEKQTEDI